MQKSFEWGIIGSNFNSDGSIPQYQKGVSEALNMISAESSLTRRPGTTLVDTLSSAISGRKVKMVNYKINDPDGTINIIMVIYWRGSVGNESSRIKLYIDSKITPLSFDSFLSNDFSSQTSYVSTKAKIRPTGKNFEERTLTLTPDNFLTSAQSQNLLLITSKVGTFQFWAQRSLADRSIIQYHFGLAESYRAPGPAMEAPVSPLNMGTVNSLEDPGQAPGGGNNLNFYNFNSIQWTQNFRANRDAFIDKGTISYVASFVDSRGQETLPGPVVSLTKGATIMGNSKTQLSTGLKYQTFPFFRSYNNEAGFGNTIPGVLSQLVELEKNNRVFNSFVDSIGFPPPGLGTGTGHIYSPTSGQNRINYLEKVVIGHQSFYPGDVEADGIGPGGTQIFPKGTQVWAFPFLRHGMFYAGSDLQRKQALRRMSNDILESHASQIYGSTPDPFNKFKFIKIYRDINGRGFFLIGIIKIPESSLASYYTVDPSRLVRTSLLDANPNVLRGFTDGIEILDFTDFPKHTLEQLWENQNDIFPLSFIDQGQIADFSHALMEEFYFFNQENLYQWVYDGNDSDNNSYLRGSPGAVGFFNERIVLGSWDNDSTKILMSNVGQNYFRRRIPVVGEDGVDFNIFANNHPRIKYFLPLRQDLLIFTDNQEMVFQGQNGVSTRSLNRGEISYEGVGDVQPIAVNTVALFVDQSNKVVRDLYYQFRRSGYDGEDLTYYVKSLFDQEIIAWAYQKSPRQVIYTVLEDGSFLMLTYRFTGHTNNPRKIFSWTRGEIKNAKVIDVVSLNDSLDIFFTVERGDGSVKVVKLNSFASENNPHIDIMERKEFSDLSSITNSAEDVIAVDAETFQEIPYSLWNVSNNPNYPSDKQVLFGHRIKSLAISPPFEIPREFQSVLRGEKRITELTLLVTDSFPFFVGPDENNLVKLKLFPTLNSTDKYSGKITKNIYPKIDLDGSIFLLTDTHLPMTVNGIDYEIEVFDQ